MTRYKDALRTATLVGGAALFLCALAPTSAGFQRPPPAKDPGMSEAHVGCLGHGKGELVLPSKDEHGRMSGLLVDCEGVRWFGFTAMLTGCMPGALIDTPRYTFGGLYGKAWKLGDTPPGVEGPSVYAFEGTWQYYGAGHGSFRAEALRYDSAGQAEVVGWLYGRFTTHTERPLAASVDFGAAAPVKPPYRDAASQPPEPPLFGDAASKPRKTFPKTRYRDAASEPPEPRPYRDAASELQKTRPKTRYRDAASEPPESSAYRDAASKPQKTTPKTRYRDAASEPPEPSAYRDAASKPQKTPPKTRYRDVATAPEPIHVGCFYLRFHFDV